MERRVTQRIRLFCFRLVFFYLSKERSKKNQLTSSSCWQKRNALQCAPGSSCQLIELQRGSKVRLENDHLGTGPRPSYVLWMNKCANCEKRRYQLHTVCLDRYTCVIILPKCISLQPHPYTIRAIFFTIFNLSKIRIQQNRTERQQNRQTDINHCGVSMSDIHLITLFCCP